MSARIRLAMFGSSLVSAYWNGAATYYRGILRALHDCGFDIEFYEPDAYDRQAHRDIPDPEYAQVIVYAASPAGAAAAVELARAADILVKASGVGVNDALLEAEIPRVAGAGTLTIFWDVDAPATLERMRRAPDDPFLRDLSGYDLVLTYGGGPPVVQEYESIGARRCIPIYNALDPDTHHPVPREARFDADLGFLGNRLPDREARVREFFLDPARRLPQRRFLLGGSGWDQGIALPGNVSYAGHVYTRDHNAFNCSPRAVLNINRDSMARTGFSPPTRVFEAAGAGACLFCDAWEGIEQFLEPEREVVCVRSGAEVEEQLAALTDVRARQVGAAARRRMLAEHTYAHRAASLREVLTDEVALASRRSHRPSTRPKEAAPEHPCARSIRASDGQEPECSEAHGRARAACSAPARAASSSLDIVFIGLAITSSWGNGHATTYRSLVKGLGQRGHRVTFLEQDRPWYEQHRDQPRSEDCETRLYSDVEDLQHRFIALIRNADAVIVGSYVNEGRRVCDWVLREARGVRAFYDIDTPVTLRGVSSDSCKYLAASQIAEFDLMLSFTGGPTLEVLEETFGAKRAAPLYCSVDLERYRPWPIQPHLALAYMGTYSEDRQPGVEAFLNGPARALPEQRFMIVGAQYPHAIAWPTNVMHREHLPPGRHAQFYASQRFTLNLTRADMRAAGYSPSVRLFEAAACGTPIISDAWPGLAEIFRPDEEIVVAARSSDVIDCLRCMSDGERNRLATNARARAIAEHSSARRAEQLERYIEAASVSRLDRSRGASAVRAAG